MLIGPAAVALMAASGAFAQGQPPAGYNEALIKAGGQSDALSMVCGKATQARVDAHKADLRQHFAAKGVAPAKFNVIYDTAFNEMKSGAAANPAQTKATCARLARGVLTG